MEFFCVVLVLVLGTCAAAPQDLRGKMFTFPEESGTNFVKMDVDLKELSAFTVCMRVFTDLLRPHTLLQLTTNSSSGIFLSNAPRPSQYYVQYNQTTVYFNSNYYKVNTWQSLCCSWMAHNGIVRLWVNGEPSSRKFLSQTPMKAPLAVVIGEVRVLLLSWVLFPSFSPSPFSGMVSDLHMWDYELRPSQIQLFGPMTNFGEGNVLSWQNLDFQTHGRVLLESKYAT
ncbi:C-reactive protein-like [Eucyclogobius newberryi]|uniref:C-reactive protein-like n=1 Tax=Eucyclogobius newberryi TaxID=166745 RepID=UPI003B5A23A0